MLLIPLLLFPLMTGCTEENISNRLYTQILGLSGTGQLTLHARAFDEEAAFSARGSSTAEALRTGEAEQGGSIFIGHTELLCLDGSRTLEDTQDLLFSQGLSPACKVLCTNVGVFFEDESSTDMLRSIRMSEKNGLLGETDLSTVLSEWLGSRKTALLPVTAGSSLGMVLLRTDGTRVLLSEDAARGMYWLRRHKTEEFSMTLQTKDGTEDITILRSSLKKTAAESTQGTVTLCYELTVHTEDCPEELHRTAAAQILAQCNAAAEEMLAANADVIGMEEVLAGYDMEPFPPQLRIQTKVIIK